MCGKRINIPKKIQLAVWRRDHWTCRYCGEPVFFNPLFKLLNKLSPGHGYYHPHGKYDTRHPFLEKRMATADHVIPVTKGGQNNIGNLVTACWDCNSKFNDKTVGIEKPAPSPINEKVATLKWDGFSSVYVIMGKEKSDEWTKLLESDIRV